MVYKRLRYNYAPAVRYAPANNDIEQILNDNAEVDVNNNVEETDNQSTYSADGLDESSDESFITLADDYADLNVTDILDFDFDFELDSLQLPLWSHFREKCSVTEDQYYPLIEAFIRYFNLPDNAAKALYNMNAMLVPSEVAKAKSREKPDTLFSKITKLCTRCDSIITKKCENMECCQKGPTSLVNSFVSSKIADQLLRLLNSYFETILEHIKDQCDLKSKGFIADVGSGRMSKSRVDYRNKKLHLSVIMAIDGVIIKCCETAEMWPVLLALADLPIKIRSSYLNCIAAAFWVGYKKPLWYIFLADIINQLQELSTSGISYRNWQVYLHVTVISADLAARCYLWNFSTWMSIDGCHTCLQKAVPRDDSNAKNWTCSDHEIHLKDRAFFDTAYKAVKQTGMPYYGVKGASILQKIVHPSESNVSESLHLIDWGVVRDIVYYILRDTGINVKLLKKIVEDVRPTISWPRCFNRTISTLKKIKCWKASEFSHFFLYVLPFALHELCEVSATLRHQQLRKFVFGLHFMLYEINCDRNLVTNIDFLRHIAVDLHLQYEQLFGPNVSTLKCHMLFHHYLDEILNYGMSWSFSAYVFESWYHLNQKLITNWNGTMDQVVRRFSSQKCSDLWRVKNAAKPGEIATFINTCMPLSVQRRAILIVNEVYIFENIVNLIPEKFLPLLPKRDWYAINWIKFRGNEYLSKHYQQNTLRSSRVNYFVKFDAPHSLENYGEIILIAYDNNSNISLLIKPYRVVKRLLLNYICNSRTLPIGGDFVEIVETDSVLDIQPEHLQNLCVKMSFSSKQYCLILNNSYSHS